MASHLEMGKKGEQLAERYLADKGYTLLHRNWRYGRYEIDLVTQKDHLLRFIEVKLRSSVQYGQPENAVNRKKIKDLMQAIDQYLYLHPQWNDFRLDVLSITQKGGNEFAYFLIEDVCL